MDRRYGHPRWRHAAIIGIKLLHSAIFLANSIAILQIFWAGVRNRPSRWTGLALAAALGEAAVWLRQISDKAASEQARALVMWRRWLAA